MPKIVPLFLYPIEKKSSRVVSRRNVKIVVESLNLDCKWLVLSANHMARSPEQSLDESNEWIAASKMQLIVNRVLAVLGANVKHSIDKK